MLEIARALLSPEHPAGGANVNQQDAQGFSALYYVALNGNVPMAQVGALRSLLAVFRAAVRLYACWGSGECASSL